MSGAFPIPGGVVVTMDSALVHDSVCNRNLSRPLIHATVSPAMTFWMSISTDSHRKACFPLPRQDVLADLK